MFPNKIEEIKETLKCLQYRDNSWMIKGNDVNGLLWAFSFIFFFLNLFICLRETENRGGSERGRGRKTVHK